MPAARNVLRAGASRDGSSVTGLETARVRDTSSVPPGWTASAVLPPLAPLSSAPGCARTFAVATVSGWGMPELSDAVRLVVSELVTNAVNATVRAGSGAGVIIVRLMTDDSRVVIEVWDQAPGRPVFREPGDFAEAGRGLGLVNAICANWGWEPAAGPAAKLVWGELTRPVPLRPEPRPPG
jgi:anti-sigma regulatory factor (Ser/Thr protein kinase)